MSHPRIDNTTPFEFAPLFLADAEGQPLFVPVLKASFAIGADGRLALPRKQPPVNVGGQWWGPPDKSSQKFEPEAVMPKPATDVVLIGHAYPARPGDTDTVVGLRVGSHVRKIVKVFGDRWWVKRAGIISMTAPQPFEKIPLQWERAFGGWDRDAIDPGAHRCEPCNPVGRGFRVRWPENEPQVALPNLEDPEDVITAFDHRPKPAGFGFLSADWQPRLALAGTYDAAWVKARMPLLPEDFDPRFLNAAPADQVVKGYLQGNEEVSVVNARPGGGPIHFALPGSGLPPQFDVTVHGGATRTLRPALDTLLIDLDEGLVSMLWRAALPVVNVPADVVAVRVAWDGGWTVPGHAHGVPAAQALDDDEGARQGHA